MQCSSYNPFAREETPWRAQFLEEKWTVFYGIKEAGNQAPLLPFTKVKVKNTAGAVLEKNKAWNAEAGTANAEIQQCYFVTVVAESAEEAVKVVDALLRGNASLAAGSVTALPRLAGNTNGKFAAALAANVEAKVVTP